MLELYDRPSKVHTGSLVGQETESRSKLGVDEVTLDTFEGFKLSTDKVPLSKD